MGGRYLGDYVHHRRLDQNRDTQDTRGIPTAAMLERCAYLYLRSHGFVFEVG